MNTFFMKILDQNLKLLLYAILIFQVKVLLYSRMSADILKFAYYY